MNDEMSDPTSDIFESFWLEKKDEDLVIADSMRLPFIFS